MSKIEVDAITQQSGSTLTVGGGASKTVVADATTVTLGRCGGTVALASGATQSGFGRTGTVDWQTGSIKTATFTAANGEGYFCNTAGGTFEVDLPAGSAGAIVSVQDYNNTFNTNALTIDPNGSEKINGGVAGGELTLNTKGQGVTFVYIDATVGWRTVAGSDDPFADVASNFVVATVSGTGNTLVTAPCCANTKIATFTGPGSLCVSSISPTPANNEVSYLVVAGGGGGASGSNQPNSYGSGGAGAGGYREAKSPAATGYTASPLDGYATPGNRVSLTVASIPIQVGGGGTALAYNAPGSGAPVASQNGSNSIFSSITAAGGGGGGTGCGGASPDNKGRAGGAGGGAGGKSPCGGGAAGAGNTPSTTPSQGFPGGTGTCSANTSAGGGGGAGAVGGNGSTPPNVGGPGGAGVASSISSASVTRAGGGGGGSGYPNTPPRNGTPAPGGAGGGGLGNGSSPSSGGGAGTDNTGGGGGGGGSTFNNANAKTGGNGGSGIVIIRYKFQ